MCAEHPNGPVEGLEPSTMSQENLYQELKSHDERLKDLHREDQAPELQAEVSIPKAERSEPEG